MARSSSSSSSEVDEDISPNNVKFETDEAKFSLQPYLFEPTIVNKKGSSSSSDSESQADEEGSNSSADESRLDNLEW
jgi:hypothetical protein